MGKNDVSTCLHPFSKRVEIQTSQSLGKCFRTCSRPPAKLQPQLHQNRRRKKQRSAALVKLLCKQGSLSPDQWRAPQPRCDAVKACVSLAPEHRSLSPGVTWNRCPSMSSPKSSSGKGATRSRLQLNGCRTTMKNLQSLTLSMLKIAG